MPLKLIACIFAVACGLAAQTGDVVAIRCGRFFDGKTLALRENVIVLVEGNRIRAAGERLAIPAGAKVIDLGNRPLCRA